jgi:hypothetical protein
MLVMPVPAMAMHWVPLWLRILVMMTMWAPGLPSILVLVLLILAEVPLRAPDLPSIMILVMPVLANALLWAPVLPSIFVTLALAMVLLWAPDPPSIPILVMLVLAKVLLMKGMAPLNAKTDKWSDHVVHDSSDDAAVSSSDDCGDSAAALRDGERLDDDADVLVARIGTRIAKHVYLMPELEVLWSGESGREAAKGEFIVDMVMHLRG